MSWRNGVVLIGLLTAGCGGAREPSNLLSLFAVDRTIVDASDLDVENTYDALTLLKWAEASFEKGDYATAASEYRRFLALYPSHPMSRLAQYRLATSEARQIEAIDRDPTPMNAAATALQAVVADDPSGPYADEARAKLAEIAHRQAEQTFNIGMFYYKRGAYRSAIARFAKALSVPGEAPLREQAHYFLGMAYQRGGYPTEASAAFEALRAEFPTSTYIAKIAARK